MAINIEVRDDPRNDPQEIDYCSGVTKSDRALPRLTTPDVESERSEVFSYTPKGVVGVSETRSKRFCQIGKIVATDLLGQKDPAGLEYAVHFGSPKPAVTVEHQVKRLWPERHSSTGVALEDGDAQRLQAGPCHCDIRFRAFNSSGASGKRPSW